MGTGAGDGVVSGEYCPCGYEVGSLSRSVRDRKGTTDARFLLKGMPEVMRHLSYRIVGEFTSRNRRGDYG